MSITEKALAYINNQPTLTAKKTNDTSIKITGLSFVGSVMYYPTTGSVVTNTPEMIAKIGAFKLPLVDLVEVLK